MSFNIKWVMPAGALLVDQQIMAPFEAELIEVPCCTKHSNHKPPLLQVSPNGLSHEIEFSNGDRRTLSTEELTQMTILQPSKSA